MVHILTIKYKIVKALKFMLPRHSPDFIIIGAQKSGTSSLHYYLNQHPELICSIPKEIHYFDRMINYGYTLKWYENHFKSLFGNNKLFFESSPNYIYHRSVANHISRYYPNIKLILILRDPVERAFSAWNMYYDMYKKGRIFKKWKGRSPGEPNAIYKYFIENKSKFPHFKETIKIELDLIKENNNDEPSILRRGIYVEQIKQYYGYFNTENILIIGFKELINDTKNALDSIYDFLGVERILVETLNLKPKNQRLYDFILEDIDREFLNNYYSDYNRILFKLIGKDLDW